jgi:hypothetical protein
MNIYNFFKRKKSVNGGEVGIKTASIIEINNLKKIIKKRGIIANSEFKKGYDLIEKYPRSVSILGSARTKEDNVYYQKARSLAGKISKELKYAVVTGGGPGIMESACRGAKEAGGVSIGFNIKLDNEQTANEYVTEHVDF